MFHLSQLNSLSTDFDLCGIPASDKDQAAVGAVPYQIAGLVQAPLAAGVAQGTALKPGWIPYEGRRGSFGIAEIARADKGALEHQLANIADGGQMAVVVDLYYPCVDTYTPAYARCDDTVLLNGCGGRDGSTFAGAVPVSHLG
jgi:hypothetical protein